MSDAWLVIFPADPCWLPDPVHEARAAAVIAALVPTAAAGQPELIRRANVEFVDAGGNFEAIRCPLCSARLAEGWWQSLMSDQYSTAGGFQLCPVTTPCCGGITALNELAYEWPLGFARWTAQVMSPERSWLTEVELIAIGEALGQPVRQTIRHI